MIKAFIGFGILAAAISIPAPKEVATAPPPVEIPTVKYDKTWECPDCTPNEKYVLSELQKHTKISDRNALATILGNIKQESNFVANICEGGARVSYSNCHSGGYGLIQWTSIGRYRALGSFAKKYNCDPSTLKCQTRFMINETTFQRYLPEFEGRGYTISCLLYTSPSPRD